MSLGKALIAKQKWLFWRADFYPANQSNLKSFQKALIDWKKAGPPKVVRLVVTGGSLT